MFNIKFISLTKNNPNLQNGDSAGYVISLTHDLYGKAGDIGSGHLHLPRVKSPWVGTLGRCPGYPGHLPKVETYPGYPTQGSFQPTLGRVNALSTYPG